jgi:hypothetical protein
LLIPSRVIPGKQEIIVRQKRASFFGGSVEWRYPIEVVNPCYGKDLDSVVLPELKKNFPKARIITLRKAGSEAEMQKAVPDEKVINVAVADNSMSGNTAHSNSKVTNYGSGKTIVLGKRPGGNAASSGLLRIDLAGLSKETKIISAQLRLAIQNTNPGGFRYGHYGSKSESEIQVWALRQEWIEGTGSWQGSFSCWMGPKYIYNRSNYRVSKGIMWGREGCADPDKDYYPDLTSKTVIGLYGKPEDTTRFFGIDVTAIVKKWQSGEVPNNGLLIKYVGKGKGKGPGVDLVSSENGDYAYRPALVIAVGE